jgi:hypothetical protein
MQATRGFEPDLAYLRTLIGAGLDGISTARHELGGGVFRPPLTAGVWKPVAIGATVGALGTRLTGSRKAGSIAVGGLVGCVVGFGAVLAWTSRRFTSHAARTSLRLVNAARDSHWLEAHPIDYA